MPRLNSDSLAPLSEAEILGMSQGFKIISGVYFLIHKGKIVYVGQSINVYARVRRHAHQQAKLFDQFAFVEVEPEQLNRVETAYIRKFQPEHNHTIFGALRTPENSNEQHLNRGASDRVSMKRELAEYCKEWEGREDEWCKMVAAKLDAKLVGA